MSFWASVPNQSNGKSARPFTSNTVGKGGVARQVNPAPAAPGRVDETGAGEAMDDLVEVVARHVVRLGHVTCGSAAPPRCRTR